jgi:hypothetical protein
MSEKIRTPSPLSRDFTTSRARGSSASGSSAAATRMPSNWGGRLPRTWVTAPIRLSLKVPWATMRMPIMLSVP